MKNNILWITLLSILFAFSAFAAEINLDVIKQIESSGNPNAVSFRGAKYGRGLYQISEIALKDYNRMAQNGAEIAPEQLFDPELNYTIAKWYIAQIKRYLTHYGIPVNKVNIIASWNWGIGNVRRWHKAGSKFEDLPRETRNFIIKYRRLNGR